MAERHWARGYDLILQSDVAVPGAAPCAPQPVADIRIVQGSVPATGGGAVSAGPGHSLLLDLAPTARFRCTADAIVVEPLPGASPARVSTLLIASALPASLWLRGEPVLHASVLVPAGTSRAVAICGGSGSGKSTALAAMLARGARVVGDDTVRVVANGDTVMVSGLAAAYRRRRHAGDEERETLPVAPDRQCARAPLAAIFVPRRAGEGEAARFERLTGVARLPALLAERHRPAMPAILGIEAEILPQFSRLAALDIYLWFRPPGPLILSDAELAFLEKVARRPAMDYRRWQRFPEFVTTMVEGSHVVFSVTSGNYIALNETANAIWDALANPVTEAALAEMLVARYEVDHDTAAAAVTRALGSLAELELVKVTD